MFNITQLNSVISHFNSISPLYKETSNEIIIRCPFCDDNNPKHGHLYISKTSPVFNCFKCSSAGTLIQLLTQTGFDDEEVLEYVSKFIHYRFRKDYYYRQKVQKSIEIDIIKENLEFQIKYPEFYSKYVQYLITRIGNVNFQKFLIIPGLLNGKIVCKFINSNNELITSRFIDNKEGELRYLLNTDSSGLYYFQNKDFEKYKRIVLTEGQFDIISLYLYSDIFKNCFFMAVSGKKFLSTIEKLVFEELLIGTYEINIVFDNDVKNYKKYLFGSKLITKGLKNICIRGWKPVIKKDTADFPSISEVF